MLKLKVEDIQRSLEEKTGIKPSKETVRTWCVRGVRGHRLESVLVGNRRFIPADAWDRFFKLLVVQQ